MKESFRFLLTAALVCAGSATLPAFAMGPKQQEGQPATESAPAGVPADGGKVQVKTPVAFAVSAPLRELPAAPGGTAAQFEAEDEFPRLLPKRLNGTPGPDLAAQSEAAPDAMPGATVFAGQQNPAACGGCLPPDTNGDIGTNHYVQIVNTQIAVYNRSGAIQPGFPKNINTLWTALGGHCAATNDGDPIALYDHLADRWFVSQFSFPNGSGSGPYDQCIAVSQGPDPTGSWYEYDFQWSATDLNDYPHFGVWPDGYYMTCHNFTNGASWNGQGVAVFERDAMIAGNPAARMVQFESLFNVNPPCSNNYGGMLPSHLEGPAPPAGTPNYFFEADAQNELCTGDPSSVKIWQFHVDWTNTANSTFGNASAGNAGPPNNVLNVTNFTRLCPTTSSCVPQTGTTRKLDGLGDRLMYRVAYRNFNSYDAVVLNHSAAVSGIAGIRWYEIHNLSSPTLIQQSTYNPDSTYRWMGSVNLDANNDIAVGFSASDSTINPQIRYAGRLVGDPINTLGQGEGTMISGGGHQTSSFNRWGDYSSLSVDPTDQCTFWYTTEYYSTTSTSNWTTEVGNFKFPSCSTCTPPSPPTAGSNSPICAGQTLQLTASTVAGGTYSWTGPNGFTSTQQNPTIANATTAASGTYSVTVTVGGCASSPATTSVTVNPLPVATITAASAVCAGSTGNAASVPNAGAGATYAWTISGGSITGGSGTNAITYTAGASGSVSLGITVTTSAGCSSPGSKSVTINSIPSAPTAGNNGPICAGSTLNLTASTISGATYSWTGPNGFASSQQNPSIANAQPAATGTYSVTATVSGCVSAAGTTSATVNAAPSAPTAGNNGPICAGSTLNLTASTISGATYSWTGPNGFASSQQNPSIANAQPAATGTYSVIATVSGCVSAAGTTSATVNAAPSAPTAGNNGPICAGSTLNLTASTISGATYSWTGPNGFTSSQQNPSIANAQPAATGTYSVTATVSGCVSAAGTTLATVNAIPTAAASGSASVCAGQSTGLTGSGGVACSWSPITGLSNPNSCTPSASPASTTTYTLTVTDASGCVSTNGPTATVTIVPLPAPVITVTRCLTPNTSGLTASVPANAGDTYAWTITGGTIDSGQGTDTISFTSGGPATLMTLSVDETNTTGCTGSASDTMQVNFNDVPVSNPFYTFICTITRDGVTAGCGSGNFCPTGNVLRSQMAVFILRGAHGPTYVPPPAVGIFSDVLASNPFARWIEEAYNEGITGGCSTNPLRYCPNNSVSRAGMAVFLLTGQHGTGYTPPACAGIFTDVACPGPFTNWIEQLYNEGITGGCNTNPLQYCPANTVTRAQMAVFLTTTFALP